MIFRILPALIILSAIMVGTRFLEVAYETPLIISEIKASEEAAAEKPKEEAKKEEGEKKEESHDEKPKEGEKKEEDAHGEKKDDGHGKSEGDKPKTAEPNFLKSTVKDKEEQESKSTQFTEIEAEVLQSLAKRRAELEKREQDISLKEASLGVVEKNIESKLNQLKALQTDLTGIIAEYNSKEDEKIKSLVKIYESMKPTEAAKIFEQLQMSVLLDVADNMKEAKLASILAKMDTYKAKELTVEIAERRRVKNN